MTPLAAVRRARVALVAGIVVGAALWALAAELAVYAAREWAGAGRAAPAPGAVALQIGLGLVVAAAVLWRGRAAISLERAALWVEERSPALEYALVTAIEPRAAHVGPELARVVARFDVSGVARRAAIRSTVPPLVAVVIAVVAAASAAAIAPRAAARALRGSGAGPSAPVPAASRLAPLVARVTEPAYAHRPPRLVKEPVTISALVGGTIELVGKGPAAGMRAALGTDSVAVADSGGAWSVRVPMPARAVVVTLRDRGAERVVGLDPVPDRPPTVVLSAPARDSTLRAASGALDLDALATDDIGLRDGHFEIIVSSGDQEGSFRSVERRVGAVTVGDAATRVPLHARVDLARLGLVPGGLLSIRAVARDGNTVDGPGVGTSETRTLRLVKTGEYDSVSVEGAPPPALDSSYVSQRMIVIRTQALVDPAPPLARDTVAHRSAALADKEEQLREAVQSLLHGPGDEGGGDGPVLLPDWQHALFDTAYQALADAARLLAASDPRGALAPERVALRVLDRARLARRIYLRGAPPSIVVNTARVRLTGADTGRPAARPPTSAADSEAAARSAALVRLESIARLAVREPGAAADSVTLLRADVVGRWPAAADALDRAGDALRSPSGGPGRAADRASLPLSRARRIIVGGSRPDVLPSSAWSGGP